MSVALQGPSGRLALENPSLTIGRAPDNQLVLDDGKASAHHALLQLQGQSYSITDLGSSNGTYLNEVRLAPQAPAPLKNGDKVRFGDTIYTYEESQPAAPAYAPTVLAGNIPSYEPTVLASQAPEVPDYQQASQPSSPAYGQNNGSSPAYPQYTPPPADPYTPLPAAPSAYPAAAPSYQQAQPSWGAGLPPSYTPPPAKRKGGLKVLLIVLVALLVVGGGGIGAAVYFLNQPQPTLSVTSTYTTGATPAGATGTTFRVAGKKFSSSSAITFLLDGNAVPGGQAVQSDSNGNVSATLKVTDGWSVGSHTLTAKDAGGYLTQKGVAIAIVTPGQAHTPGPNGAPSDDASGTILASVQSTDGSTTLTLKVTGKADGGTVCRSIDDGQPHDTTGTTSGIGYTETTVATCSGTYKGGKLTYTETVTSDKIAFDNGVSCTAQVPYVATHLEGTFTSAVAVNGTYTSDAVTVTCDHGLGSNTTTAGQGTWTGAASMQ